MRAIGVEQVYGALAELLLARRSGPDSTFVR
jgi:hypothetical protein